MKSVTKEIQENTSTIEVLDILKQGNNRFTNNQRIHNNLLDQVNDTAKGQWPLATVLSCIDSRVPVELIFDQGIGHIFSARVAGNIVNSDIIGSMEFACKIAGAKLLIVMGHTHCGAIKGACDHVEIGNLTGLLAKIQPAIYKERTVNNPDERNSSNIDFVQKVAVINVENAVHSVLERSAVLNEMVKNGEVGIIGAMYDVETGKVHFYPETFQFKT